MAFDTKNGTRGARQPGPVLLMRWGNHMVVNRIRRRRGTQFLGMNVLVLSTIGKRSGLPRSTPLAWFPGEAGTWLIVASAGGARRNPSWYYNVAAHPDQVMIEVDGPAIKVRATQLHGAERDAAWAQVIKTAPRYGKYATTTDRVIPIIRLTALDAEDSAQA